MRRTFMITYSFAIFFVVLDAFLGKYTTEAVVHSHCVKVAAPKNSGSTTSSLHYSTFNPKVSNTSVGIVWEDNHTKGNACAQP